ncbi:MAG: M48 family metalloprotease [Candidatus Cloacimonetes bacterium]|nr:M48 family metalloprotease [Candidatus Cloacimonadota bacterium]
MDYSLLRIELEKQFTQEIKESLRVELIEKLLEKAKIDREDSLNKIFKGIYFKVTENFCKNIWEACQEAQKRTGYEGTIDYFVVNSPEYNAFCIETDRVEDPHIICLNSALVKDFTHEELLFIIGHEIGHLWTGSRKLSDVIQFIFNENKEIPIYYHNRIMYWQRLSELSADRFGLLACGELEPAVSSFFKLTSGLDWRELGINIRTYIDNNNELLEHLKGEQGFDESTHPINPVRVKALQLFSKSQLFQSAMKKDELIADEKLEDKIRMIVEEHTALADGINLQRMMFMATGGLIVSSCDEKVDADEVDRIISYISQYTLFPKKFLEEILKDQKNIQKKFVDSIKKILADSPLERESMLKYLLEIAISDNDINDKEFDLLVNIGINILGYSEKEAAQILAAGLYTQFIPRV